MDHSAVLEIAKQDNGAAYTGPERRWQTSRAWSDWSRRQVHSANQSALSHSRNADILLQLRGRAKNRANQDALWEGYWYVKEQRDYWRGRVAAETAPWFDGSAFATLERNYCEACGYTESHDPNCPRPQGVA